MNCRRTLSEIKFSERMRIRILPFVTEYRPSVLNLELELELNTVNLSDKIIK